MIGTRTNGAADSLMDSLAEAVGVPTERILEFWLHRTRRGQSIITVRIDASDVASPPIQRVYQLTEYPDAEHPPRPDNKPAGLPILDQPPVIREGPGAPATETKPEGWTVDLEPPAQTGKTKRRKSLWRNNQTP